MTSEFPPKVCLLAKVTMSPSFDYQFPLRDFFKKQFPDFFLYDFDNFSEGLLIDYATQLLNAAQQVVFVAEAVPSSPLGSLLKFIPHLHRHKTKVQAMLQGEHGPLQKMLNPLETFAHNLSEPAIIKFINTQ